MPDVYRGRRPRARARDERRAGDGRVRGDGPRDGGGAPRGREREPHARRGVLAPRRGERRRGLADLGRVHEEARGEPAGADVTPEPPRARVVRDEREIDVAERADEAVEVADPGAHVGDRVERVGGAEARAPHLLVHRGDEELHEPDRARRRDGVRVEPRLDAHDREDEQRIERGGRGLLDDGARDADPGRGRDPARPPRELVVHGRCTADPGGVRAAVRRDRRERRGAAGRVEAAAHASRAEREGRAGARERGGAFREGRAGGRASHRPAT
jgi:hypothetical protein